MGGVVQHRRSAARRCVLAEHRREAAPLLMRLGELNDVDLELATAHEAKAD